MIRTIFFFVILWLSLLVSMLLFLPWLFLLHRSLREIRIRYTGYCTRLWARLVIWSSGSEIQVLGKELIPGDPDFIIISNHQGYMDIPVLMSVFPFALAFVAKKELMYVPFINCWLLGLGAIVINRNKPLLSMRKLEAEMIKPRENPIVLFPEGTRSKTGSEGKSKPGGLRMVKISGKKNVHVQISGSYRIWEEKKRIRPGRIMVNISE